MAGGHTLRDSGKPVKVAESDVDVSRWFSFPTFLSSVKLLESHLLLSDGRGFRDNEVECEETIICFRQVKYLFVAAL